MSEVESVGVGLLKSCEWLSVSPSGGSLAALVVFDDSAGVVVCDYAPIIPTPAFRLLSADSSRAGDPCSCIL